jgi:hypothetical protein
MVLASYELIDDSHPVKISECPLHHRCGTSCENFRSIHFKDYIIIVRLKNIIINKILSA